MVYEIDCHFFVNDDQKNLYLCSLGDIYFLHQDDKKEIKG